MTNDQRPGRLPVRTPGASPIGRRKYDWESVKQVYVEGRVDDSGNRTYPTLQQVADLFEIQSSRVREAAARGEWTAARAAFQAHVEKVRQEKRAADLAKEGVALDESALKVSKLGVSLITARIGEIANEMGKRSQAKKKYEEAKARGAGPEELDEIDYDPWAPPAVDSREVSSLASAATQWHSLAMKALGEPETVRHELTGANGSPLEVRSSIRAEMVRDDPARLHALLVAVERAQLGVQVQGTVVGAGDGDEPRGEVGAP